MRIVHVLHFYPPEFRGGTESCVEMLAEAQLAAGHQVLVVAGTDRRDAAGGVLSEEVGGVAVRRILRTPDECYSMDHRQPRMGAAVVEAVAAEQPDIVHLHHTLNLSGDLAARFDRAGLPVVATLHDYTMVCARWFLVRPDGDSCADAFPLPGERCVECVLPDFEAGREALMYETDMRAQTARAEAAAIRLAIAPSRIVTERWERSGLFAPGKLVTLPHAVRLAAQAVPPARNRSDGRLVLATWGHLAPAKGVLDLLDALRAAADPRLSLIVLGDPVDADFAEQLLDAAEGLAVEFRGAFSPVELRDLRRDADLAVFVSRAEETFGLVVAEARALGFGLVVSDRGALPEGVGQAGTVTPAADPAALARLLLELLEDPSPLEGWERAGRQGLASPSAHAQAVAAFYERALTGAHS